MYFVYLLKDKKTNELYYGFTNNLKRRLKEHNDKKRKLIYYEACISEEDARAREQSLKHYGQSRTHLKNRLRNSLQI